MKMKKIYFGILSILLAFSVSIAGFTAEAKADESLSRVVDEANLLTDSEEDSLKEMIDDIRNEYRFDVVILTLNNLGGKDAVEYADDHFDDEGYGYGTNYDGILFLISMKEREWVISTHGYGTRAFTDYGTDTIGDIVQPYLSDGDYYEGFYKFVGLCEEFLDEADNGTPYDTNNKYDSRTFADKVLGVIFRVIISLVVGLISAAIYTKMLKSSMCTVQNQQRAVEYAKGDATITYQNDQFVSTHTSRIRKAENNSSGGGGGTRTHRSSSGRSHGGSRGKF